MSINLEAERRNRGYSVRSAAHAMGISRPTLERAERGDGVHPASAKVIADFYEVKVTDIWPVEPDEVAA